MLADNDLDAKVHKRLIDSDEPAETTAYPQWADAPVAAPSEPQPQFGALLELRQLADPEADTGQDAEAWHLPPPGIHTTGSQLRRQFVTAESIARLAAHEKPNLVRDLIRRLLRRK
ncbi:MULTISPECIES: hypothetical protein [unclassified Novosphingobium]|uniref:hypothetical protein n=1 Tax=unclassified Novosphingobium TaxID=2644732 RepID=UPI00135B995B|nr:MULTISPECIES: hypothetical protein [unclassified Novosphingobium]